MKQVTVLLLFLVLPVESLAQQHRNPQSKPLVFTHVTIIDGTGAPAKLGYDGGDRR
jgi:hypothetical protein